MDIRMPSAMQMDAWESNGDILSGVSNIKRSGSMSAADGR